jgi:hypothetical protein
VPEISSNEAEPIKLVIVDQSRDALDAARDRADHRLDSEVGEGSGFRRFINGIWKGNLAKDYYRNKYTEEARANIESANNVLLFEASDNASGRATESTIERFQSEYDELIHTEAGERREVQDSDSELATGMKGLIQRYCNGELDDNTLPEERTRLLNAYRDTHGAEAIGRGIVVVDNLLEVAQAVAGAIEHGESLDNVIDKMQVISGEARSGVRTEANFNAVDRTIDRISKSKIGSIVGPNVVAAAVSITASALRVGSHSVVGAVMKPILPGIAAGAWAGLRENKRMKDERVQHSREMAQGKEFSLGAKRREEMEQTRYESISAIDLTEHLRTISAGEKLDNDGNEALQAALDALAATETRVKLSDRRHIDLITFTNPAAVGDERMALDLARAEVKAALGARLTADVRQELGIDELASVNDILRAKSDTFLELIEGDISLKDESFKKIKNRHIAHAVAVGALSGLTIGLLSQEVMAAVDPTRVGLIEQMWHAHNTTIGGVEHQTVLHGLFAGNQAIENTGPSGDYVSHAFGANSEMSVSNGNTIIDNGNGTFSLADHGGHVTAENIAINQDGSLPQDSIDQLNKLGMVVNDKSFDTDVVTNHMQEVGVNDYMQDHIAETTHVARDLWYDNNTPDVFDKNELRLNWGGNSGVTDTGYQLHTSFMTPDGSYHDGQSVDWSEAAKSGNLKLAVSATVDTQTQVFMVDIGPDGNINIPADSPAGHFFSLNGGNAEFHGAYAEVVQVTGVDSNGVDHIRPLATLVGDKNPGPIFESVPVTTIEHHAVYDVIQNYTEMAPFIPVESRSSMEAMKTKSGPEQNYYYRGSEYLSSAELAIIREETSPRLLDNPESNLILGDELDWYKEVLIKKRGKAYADSIEEAIASSPELANISSEVDTIVKVPVNAAGEAESEGIYNVLTRAYGQQDKEALDSTLLLLHVNWFDHYDQDEDIMRTNIEHTKSEIQRAKDDFPDLRVAVFETEWKRAEVERGVIGHVGRKTNDVALLALQSAISGGKMSRGHEVLLIRNDADPKGIAVHYLKRYIDSFKSNPETDVFTGTTSFDNTKASRLPGFVFAANFLQSLDLISSCRERTCHTGGANFGVRASVFAAVGAIGFDDSYNGAASDDVVIGRRINAARGSRLLSPRQKIIEYSRRAYDTNDNSQDKPKRRTSVRVHGARVDTDSDRGEELYEKGIPILYQWNPEHGFSDNGYKPRNAKLKNSMQESVLRDTNTVIERIRNDMEGSINGTRMSKAVIDAGLAFTFPGLSTKAYELTGTDGHYKLKITAEGAKYLKNYLTKDSAGRTDFYGKRKMRQIYGQISRGSFRQPNGRSLIRV